MARTGIEPATQGFSVLQNHYRQYPWMTLNQPTLTDPTGKKGLFPANLSDRRQSNSKRGNRQLRQYYGIQDLFLPKKNKITFYENYR